MAKQSGLGDRSFIDGYRVSGDIEAFNSIEGGPDALDCTSIEDLGMARLGGKRDGKLSFQAYFNPGAAADDAHNVLSALPTADRVVSYCRGTTLGAPVCSAVAKQIGYDGDRGESGEFKFGIEAESNDYGINWGELLTVGGEYTSTAAENLAGFDSGAASTDFGLQAFMHVTGITGTSATVTLEHSDDDGVGDAYTAIPGAAFTAASTVGGQRIQAARNETIKRWIRVAITGTYSECKVMVMAARNATYTKF